MNKKLDISILIIAVKLLIPSIASGCNEYSTELLGNINEMRLEKKLIDVNVSVDGKLFGAHKIVLLANSPHFDEVIKSNEKTVILSDQNAEDIKRKIDDAYTGRLTISDSTVQLPEVRTDESESQSNIRRDSHSPINEASGCNENSSKLLEKINELRLGNKLIDYHIEVDGESFYTHKLVLSALSGFFHDMFTTFKLEEKPMNTIPYRLDRETFDKIINYAYTGEITINDDSNVEALLHAASYLQIWNIESKCCRYYKEQLNADNCLRIKNIAIQGSDLLGNITNFVLEAFEEVVQSEDFLGLTKDQLIDIISDDTLNASEDKVYEAVMRWIRHKDTPDGDRSVYSPDILQHVRFPQMDQDYLELVIDDSLIKACEKCLKYVNEAKDHLRPYYQRGVENKYSLGERFKPRISNYLFAVGGYIGSPMSNVERYDLRSNKWTEVARISSRSSVGVATMNNILYAVGGYSYPHFLSSIEYYEPHADRWVNNIATLERGRTTQNGVASLNGILYVIGGSGGFPDPNLVSVVKYDSNINEWIECKPLKQKRYAYAVGVLNDYIYVVGGRAGGEISNMVEAYDPRQNEWRNVHPMIIKRFYLAIAAHRGNLYAVGGIAANGEILNSAEKYNPREDSWKVISPMDKPRYCFGLAGVNGLIYAAGGRNLNINNLDTVEVYDVATDTWSERARMLHARSGFGLSALQAKHPL